MSPIVAAAGAAKIRVREDKEVAVHARRARAAVPTGQEGVRREPHHSKPQRGAGGGLDRVRPERRKMHLVPGPVAFSLDDPQGGSAYAAVAYVRQ